MANKTTEEHKVFETVEEQALHRPGMWIGSTKTSIRPISVIDDTGFAEKELEIIPAVAKLVEEIIVNSADEHVKTQNKALRGWTLNKIDITLTSNGHLTVRDNGGITSKLHSSGAYPVEVIFGKLFSSSNYDDTKVRTTVGTNGVGSSLTNLFSNRFSVQSADGKNEVDVTWTDNKSKMSKPIVTATSEHYTKVYAELDLSRFDIETIPFGIMKYTERLAIILAASYPGLEVNFNGEQYKFQNFKEYVDLYGNGKEIIGEKTADWEIYIAPAYGTPRRYAIVNGAECNEGTHIKQAETIINKRVQAMVDKLKLSTITSHMMKTQYTVFINMKVNQPQYSSQAKTELTNEMATVLPNGDKKWITISGKLSDQIKSSFIVDQLKQADADKKNSLQNQKVQQKAKLLNKTSAKTVKKLLDAGAKTKAERKKCELWIFEGESAGAGFRPARSPKHQGCYFLKGKCVNSINMPTLKVLNNQEFSDIVIALGLDPRDPSNISKLRYGKIIISTDADVDGFSIFGQLYTLFAIHFPALLDAGMVYRAKSPVYRATKGKDNQYFYRVDDYIEFTKKNKGYKGKYFKGLGSLQKADYKAMISESKLERYSLDDESLEIVHAFMGKDAKPRKRLLESEV